MKFRVQYKDPDYYCENWKELDEESEDFFYQVAGEYITVEFDSETKTVVVIDNKGNKV